jgi:hypothetical protein
MDEVFTLREVCRSLLAGDVRAGASLLNENVPFVHVDALAPGGPDEEQNWVTTSMIRNSVKSLFSLADLGWKLLPILKTRWDGQLGFFITYLENHPELRTTPGIREWIGPARRTA